MHILEYMATDQKVGSSNLLTHTKPLKMRVFEGFLFT